MSRLMDIDAFIKKYGDWYTEEGSEEGYIGTIKGIVEDMPTIEERKTGKWIDGKCNKCGTHAPYWAMASTYYLSEYCPHCGARLVHEGEDNADTKSNHGRLPSSR